MSDPWPCEAMSLGASSDQSDHPLLRCRILSRYVFSDHIFLAPLSPKTPSSTIRQCPFVIVNPRSVCLPIILTPSRQPPVALRICKRRPCYDLALSFWLVVRRQTPDAFFPVPFSSGRRKFVTCETDYFVRPFSRVPMTSRDEKNSG
jgi:hypothetical protein